MKLIKDQLIQRLRYDGPCSTPELAAALSVSPSTVSRELRALDSLLSLGKARRTKHGLRRLISGVGESTPVYEITDRPRRLGTLHAVAPDGFAFEPVEGPVLWTSDLPWFLFDLRPAGYLGRQIPARHPDLDVPTDIHRWTSDDVLRYLCTYGHDSVGALVVGERALLGVTPPVVVDRSAFEALAVDALATGPVGSSAGGEQPKFVTHTTHGAVLIKFSPRDSGAFATRRSDLLVCEHLVLETLREAGKDAPRSYVHQVERTFLELERFDRPDGARRGQVMLTGVDAEFVGVGDAWVPVVEGLRRQKRVSEDVVQEARWRHQFGEWIANSDMHLGNLSIRMDGTTLGELTPNYDMLPMLYAPVAGEVIPRAFEPAVTSTDGSLLSSVLPVAIRFWERAAADERISDGFRGIAVENAQKLRALTDRVAWLPA